MTRCFPIDGGFLASAFMGLSRPIKRLTKVPVGSAICRHELGGRGSREENAAPSPDFPQVQCHQVLAPACLHPVCREIRSSAEWNGLGIVWLHFGLWDPS